MCVVYHIALENLGDVKYNGFKIKMWQKACIRSTEDKFTE